MLTAYQVQTGAYVTEYGELLCPDCVNENLDEHLEKGGLTPISNYELDEVQTTDAYYDDEYHVDCGCAPALLDANGHELLEEYHDEYAHGPALEEGSA